MEDVKISIIVPVYNVEQYLEKCLDSLVNQTMKEIEIIVVDDASPDNCKTIMEKYSNQYPDVIRCVYQEVNQGQGMARNKGMDIANGEYLLFVDSDDYVDVKMCEKLYQVAYEKDSDVVCCEYYEVKPDGRCNAISGYATQVMGQLNDEKRRILLSSLSPHPVCKLIRKSILIDNNIYFQKDFRCGEDYAVIALLWIYAQTIFEIKEPLYYYRRNNESSTMKKNNPDYYDVYKVAWYVCEEIKRRGFYKEYQSYKEDILTRGFIEETKFFVNCVDEPDIEELKWLRESVLKNIPNYEKNIIAYMRNEPKAIVAANILMKSAEDFCDILVKHKQECFAGSYDSYYDMCRNTIQELFDYCEIHQYNIAIWGAGLKGKNFLRVCDPLAASVKYIVDKNESSWGKRLDTGHIIRSFREISKDIDVVLVINKVYFGGIYREVKAIDEKIKVVNLDLLLMSDIIKDIKDFME